MITRVFSNCFGIMSGFCLGHLSIAEVYLLTLSGPIYSSWISTPDTLKVSTMYFVSQDGRCHPQVRRFGGDKKYQSINQLHFYSTKMPGIAKLSGVTTKQQNWKSSSAKSTGHQACWCLQRVKGQVKGMRFETFLQDCSWGGWVNR